jgi:hypothetical protein
VVKAKHQTPKSLVEAIKGHRLTPIRARLPQRPPILDRFFEGAFAVELSSRPRSAIQFARRLADLRQEAELAGGCMASANLPE